MPGQGYGTTPPVQPAAVAQGEVSWRTISLNLSAVITGQELIAPGNAYTEVVVRFLSAGAVGYLIFGAQRGQQDPVLFAGQTWNFPVPSNQGLYFTNPFAQAGLKIQLFVAFVSQGGGLISAEGVFPRPAKQLSFRATYANPTRPYALSIAAVANTQVVVASLSHLANSVRNIRLRHVWVAVESVTVAGIFMFFLQSTTGVGPPTGGTLVSAAGYTPINSEAQAMVSPTAGTFVLGTTYQGLEEFNLGATGAASTVNPPPPLNWVDLLWRAGFAPDEGHDLPFLAAGQLGEWCVFLDPSATSTVKCYVIIGFTEEFAV